MSIKIKISIIAICFALVAAVCIGFVFASPNETVNLKGMINYEVPKITITASPNDSNLGSTNGSGDYSIGDTINLSATHSGSNSFLAWATSTDPNTMEILSTSTTYSFELAEDSPTTYYALFNSTTSIKQTVEDLIYTFYNEAKLASVTDTTSTSLSGAFEIPSVVPGGENSYKVYSIGGEAFDSCSSLTSITIPEGVTSIGEWAFYSCSGLTEITIPEGVTSIGSSAFYFCSSLTSITLPSTLTSIGNEAFWDCSGLTSITLPSTLTSIGQYAFYDCTGLTSITLSSTLTSIGQHAFYNCSSLTSITLPSTLTSIGYRAFEGCSSLTSITLPPRTLTLIGDYAFRDCSSLTEITINGNISTLGSGAFQSCTDLTKLTLGANVTSIPSNLFTNNNLLNLTEIVVEEGASLSTALPNYATWYKDDDPTAVTNFSGAGTYSTTQPTIITVEANQASLGSVSGGGTFDLGDTVTLRATRSGSNTFLAWATSLDPNTMEILSTSATYSFELTMDSPRTYYALFNQTTSTSQTVGDLVYTFYNEAKLARVTDTTSTSVPSGDFTIPSVVSSGKNSYKVYSIGSSAFHGCSSLISITIPGGVTSIGIQAFSSCSGLTSITLPSTLTSIGGSAFQSCSSLTSITIPEGVTSISDFAFYNCSNLTSITLPSTLTSIGSYAFGYCRSLTEITINGNISSLGSSAFLNCRSLTKLTLGAGATSIPSNLFTDSNLINLNEIVVLGDLNSTTFPTGTWLKGGATVTNFSGAGTYTRTDV